MSFKLQKIGIFLLVVLMTGCGGGGGGASTGTAGSGTSSSAGSTGSSSSAGISKNDIGSAWEELPQYNNTMQGIELKRVRIDKIDLKEIGDSIAHYELQNGKQSVADLTEVGNTDANLSNKASPLTIQKATFYRVGVTFTTNTTFPDGLFFTVSLVGTDKDNPVNKTVLIQNAFVLKSGKQTLYGDILIPDNLPAGQYLLIAKVANDQLDALVSEQQTIIEIPQIGATYVDIEESTEPRKAYVLDINTTKNIDLSYSSSRDFPYIANNFIQHESGKGSLLFSNISHSNIQAVVSADLKLPSGKTVSLGLLNPNTKTIENTVVLTLPAERELKLSDLVQVTKIDITQQITKRARPKPPGSMTSEVEDELKNVQAIPQRAFIPLAQNKAAKGEKRYRVRLGYYIPQDAYKEVLDNAADLTRGFSITPAEGSVEWHVRFLDTQAVQKMAEYAKIFKIKNWIAGMTLNHNDWISEQLHPIDAALLKDSQTAYVFSGNKYAKINPETGELTGDWEKTTGLYDGGAVYLSYPISAAVTLSSNTYLFINDMDKVIVHNDIFDTLGVKKIKDINPANMRIINESGSTVVGQCLNAHLDVTKIDAAFKDDKDAYFIAGDDYVQIAWNEDEGTYECQFGKVGDREEWKAVGDLPVTAALSDYKPQRGRLRFYLNGFKAIVLLNKPDIFKDERNSFINEVGDSDIASLKLDARYGIQARWVVPGVHGYANADLDLYLFGYPLKLFEAKGEAYGSVKKLHPYAIGNGSVEAKSGTALYMEMMGYKFIDENMIKNEEVSIGINPDAVKQSTSRGLIPKPTFKSDLMNMTWNETYEVFSIRIPAGPIMLSVAGGIDGSLNIATPVVLNDNAEALSESVSITPSVVSKMGAYMNGGVDYDLVKAGVKGQINLIQTGVKGKLEAKLGFDTNSTSIDFDVTAKIAGEIRLVNAALSLYAGTRTHIEWCSSWGIPYPCGLGWDVWDIPIYESPWLYNYEPTLLDTTLVKYEIPLK